MRICSFLPSATEILYALGLEESICGVTFECDFPPAERTKPTVVNTRLPHAPESAEIDRIVREFVSRRESLYRVEGVTGVEVLAHLLHPERAASPVEGAFGAL